MLFHGNPILIQGFNTFLPPGYRIDIGTDPRSANTITVTTPMGVTTQQTMPFGAPIRLPREPARSDSESLQCSASLARGAAALEAFEFVCSWFLRLAAQLRVLALLSCEGLLGVGRLGGVRRAACGGWVSDAERAESCGEVVCLF